MRTGPSPRGTGPEEVAHPVLRPLPRGGEGRGLAPAGLAPESPASFAGLAAMVRQLAEARPLSTVLVTSPRPADGKSTVAAGFARAMCAAGPSVLVVDASLRAPAMHRLLGVAPAPGLRELVEGRASAGEATQPVRDAVGAGSGASGALAVVPAGDAAAAAIAILTSPRLKEALEDVRRGFDLVVLDSPAVLAAPDAALLAPLADGVLLVLSTGVATEAEAREARARLEEAGGTLLGAVLNRFDRRAHGSPLYPYAAARPADGAGQGK